MHLHLLIAHTHCLRCCTATLPSLPFRHCCCDNCCCCCQAYILFRAKLASPFTFSSGPESLEVALFDPASIPFDQIAFSSISITLRHYLQV